MVSIKKKALPRSRSPPGAPAKSRNAKREMPASSPEHEENEPRANERARKRSG